MTKINKLGKSTFVIAILSFLLVAVLAFGGTYAYFSDKSATVTSTVTMGNLKLDTVNTTASTYKATIAAAVPNQPVLVGDVTADVTTDTNINYFIRFSVQVTGVTLVGDHAAGDDCADKNQDLLSLGTITGWEAGTANATNAATDADYYYLTSAQTADADPHKVTFNIKINDKVGQVGSEHFMGAEVTVSVTFEVIQADYIIGDGSAVAGTGITVAQLEDAWTKANTAL